LRFSISISSSIIFRYYDETWQTREFQCPECNWSGRPKEDIHNEFFRDLMHFKCPECGKILVIVSYPTLNQIQAAAAKGIPEAILQLKLINRNSK
jgi:predicted RNA-binding Zn-ribbon protein involved in translation (DUF1610 family)